MKVSCTLVAYMTTSPQSKLMRLAEARLFTKFLAGASSVMSLHLDGHSVGKDINYCDGRRWVLALRHALGWLYEAAAPAWHSCISLSCIPARCLD